MIKSRKLTNKVQKSLKPKTKQFPSLKKKYQFVESNSTKKMKASRSFRKRRCQPKSSLQEKKKRSLPWPIQCLTRKS